MPGPYSSEYFPLLIFQKNVMSEASISKLTEQWTPLGWFEFSVFKKTHIFHELPRRFMSYLMALYFCQLICVFFFLSKICHWWGMTIFFNTENSTESSILVMSEFFNGFIPKVRKWGVLRNSRGIGPRMN